MAEVKWIKFYIDMFDKRKIKKIRRLPDGDKILLFWVMLLATAGKCNAGGMIFITENVPFEEEDLADEFDFEVNTIKLALDVFVKLDMISISEEGYILVNGWEEHQNIDKLAELREYNRIAQQKARAKKKLLQKSTDVIDLSMTSQLCQDTDKEKEKEKEKEEDLLITTTTTGGVPTVTDVYLYFKEFIDNAIEEAEKFHAFNAVLKWSCLPDWQAAGDLWIARIKEHR